MNGVFSKYLDKNRERKVVFYGRVSTEHEAQLSALQNQMQWYEDQLRYHPNWKLVDRYIDEGITGTQAKKRPSFLKMLEDAKEEKFDLIVTREVCRFARNTVDTLVTTRELKSIGVEVFFVEDNIWTMDNDGELRLTIMATLAQDESRKISERVINGQIVSRQKGVLYGSGNILGYDRVGKTYVVNPEQAETVRMIYDLYEEGLGMSQIRNEMIRRGRKDGSGLVRWENTKISRILHNATYKGYMGYLKSHRNNYLEQKIVRNHDEDTYMYVKGDFEPIISEEQWDRCRQIRDGRRRTVHFFSDKGKEVPHTAGVNTKKDIWTRKLKCRCGCSFRKNKWRKNSDGEVVYGYKCYNQLNNGSRAIRVDSGLSGDRYCDLRELADWKLEMMARDIFQVLFSNKELVERKVEELLSKKGNYSRSSSNHKTAEIDYQIKKIEKRMEALATMRMDGELSKEEYLKLKEGLEKELSEQRKALDSITDREERVVKRKVDVDTSYVKTVIQEKLDFTQLQVDRGMLDKLVDKIVPETEEIFSWYMNFGFAEEPDEEKELVFEFTIGFKEAREYKKARSGMLRNNQWNDLTVRIYI